MECVIDRLEGDYAVVEYGGTMLNLPKAFLPIDIIEGDVLDVIITVDEKRKEELRESADKLMDAVWQE